MLATGCGTSPLLGQAAPSATAIACPGQGWTKYPSPPQVNKEHVFCGEIKSGSAKGFHSRPSGQNPATVTSFNITQPANKVGVYGGQVNLSIHGSTAKKFSTMFPDSCNMDQVLKSILHAKANLTSCPSGAPSWAKCGMNRPSSTSSTYCAGTNSNKFYIAMGFLSNGDVNTAFPIYQ